MKTHQKMCWNCDGHVHIYELQCPYCGADLTEVEKKEEVIQAKQPLKNSADEEHVSAPLSVQKRIQSLEEELENPPFQNVVGESQKNTHIQKVEHDSEASLKPDSENPLASLLLLLPGSLFFLFGLALFLFSEDGYLVFRFSTKYWYVYLITSWPLLYFGWRSLFPVGSGPRETSEEKIDL